MKMRDLLIKTINIMKRIFGLLVLVLLVGCTCLSQVSTQTIYTTDTTCEAPLIDYREIVPVSDNCDVDTYTQTPPPGTILSPANPSVNVHLQVIDDQGNASDVYFDVILLDTISPTFHFPDSLLVYSAEDAGNMYTVFEAYVQESLLEWITFEPQWDTTSFNVNADPVMIFKNTIAVDQEMYQTYLKRGQND